ncbi:MAG: formylglycine-generating enzyme family protein, partial [Zetaproteobacteria bacterium]
EVTRAQYQRCVAAGACVPSLVSDDGPALPVVAIDAASAARYCAFVGGRLPTEAEWEKAARGADDRRRFPWGELYDGGLANHGRPPLRADASDGFAGLSPVGVMPGGASPYGLLDLAGNAWEWTGSLYEPYPLRAEAILPTDDDVRRGLRVMRGGCWRYSAEYCRSAHRHRFQGHLTYDYAGIRVALSHKGAASVTEEAAP